MVMENFQLQGKSLPNQEYIKQTAETWERYFLQVIPQEYLWECWEKTVRNHGDFKTPINPREIFAEWLFRKTQLENQTMLENRQNIVEAEPVSAEEFKEFIQKVRMMLRRM